MAKINSIKLNPARVAARAARAESESKLTAEQRAARILLKREKSTRAR